VSYRLENELAEPSWFNGAVPSFGPPEGAEAVRLLVLGMAPGRQGANRTGRPFTGDWAGDLLYASLLRFGLAEGNYDRRADDGLVLKGTMISNAVRCVPPQNKPLGEEVAHCRPFLTSRIESLPNLKVVVTLGKIAHDALLRTLGLKLKDHAFAHDFRRETEGPNGALILRASYHCSRYNTNTGRLTEEMFDHVMGGAKDDAF
jgi:uracil-DNA glycosylase family 4